MRLRLESLAVDRSATVRLVAVRVRWARAGRDFGVVLSLWQRDRVGGDCRGRNLDVALTDSVLSLTEGMSGIRRAGQVRQPTGSRIPTAAPSSAYRSMITPGARRPPLLGPAAAFSRALRAVVRSSGPN